MEKNIMTFLSTFWKYQFFDKRQKEVPIKEIPSPEVVYKLSKPAQNTQYVIIEPYETFKVHDLANMFPFNITPALIESKIQHAIAAKQSIMNRLTPQFVIMFIMILIGAAVVFIMLWKFTGQGQQEVIVKLGPGLQNIQ